MELSCYSLSFSNQWDRLVGAIKVDPEIPKEETSSKTNLIAEEVIAMIRKPQDNQDANLWSLLSEKVRKIKDNSKELGLKQQSYLLRIVGLALFLPVDATPDKLSDLILKYLNSLIVGKVRTHGLNWNLLPKDIFFFILSQISLEELLKIRLVNKFFKDLIGHAAFFPILEKKIKTTSAFQRLAVTLQIGKEEVKEINLKGLDLQNISNRHFLNKLKKACPNLKKIVFPSLYFRNKNCVVNIDHLFIPLLIQQFPNLEEVDFTHCFDICSAVSLPLIHDVAIRCQKLKTIRVKEAQLINRINIRELAAKCPDLENVYLGDCSYLTDQDFQFFISHCSKLKRLSLHNCPHLTDKTLELIAQRCPQLEFINVMACQITDQSIKTLVTQCKNLKKIILNSCFDLTDESIFALATNYPFLQTIKLKGCAKLSDQAIISLAIHCHHLEVVDFSAIPNLTDTSIVLLAKNCPLLKSVWLGECQNLTGISIQALADFCPRLRKVEFSFISSLKDSDIQILVEKCKKLKLIKLESCRALGNKTAFAIAQNCSKLVKINLYDTLVTGIGYRKIIEQCKKLDYLYPLFLLKQEYNIIEEFDR